MDKTPGPVAFKKPRLGPINLFLKDYFILSIPWVDLVFDKLDVFKRGECAKNSCNFLHKKTFWNLTDSTTKGLLRVATPFLSNRV